MYFFVSLLLKPAASSLYVCTYSFINFKKRVWAFPTVFAKKKAAVQHLLINNHAPLLPTYGENQWGPRQL
jgi:hypothetical protein